MENLFNSILILNKNKKFNHNRFKSNQFKLKKDKHKNQYNLNKIQQEEILKFKNKCSNLFHIILKINQIINPKHNLEIHNQYNNKINNRINLIINQFNHINNQFKLINNQKKIYKNHLLLKNYLSLNRMIIIKVQIKNNLMIIMIIEVRVHSIQEKIFF